MNRTAIDKDFAQEHQASAPMPMPMPMPMRLAVAPMMERTDRHCRYFLRLLAPHARLYTEMITSAALVRGERHDLLAYSEPEHPLALQLGGSDPHELAEAARLGAAAGYDEINLNAGCPSDRVQAGKFGAALMLEPARVAACVHAMRSAVTIPVTVKTRLGVDNHDSYAFLSDFVARVADAGCDSFIIHARKAWLKGLSPKQNREVPPLDYARVRQLKRDFPMLEIVLNGGLNTAEPALAELAHVDGLMVGRAAYTDPCLLARLDHAIFGARPAEANRASTDAGRTGRRADEICDMSHTDDVPHWSPQRRLEALQAYVPYLERELDRGTPLKSMARHLHGLFAGVPGGRAWRRSLGELSNAPEDFRRSLESLVSAAAACGSQSPVAVAD